MKTLNASFTDLNGKIIKVETEEQLIKQIDFALWYIDIQSTSKTLPKEYQDKIIEYWQHRLACLKTIKKENIKTVFQLWQSGEISGFGSFQTNILQAYQIADSGNRARLNAAFPEWFVL